MIVRSKAPLRLGLAGGGTDVSPFSDIYGGCILNATISLYAYCDIVPRQDGKIIFITEDRGERFESVSKRELPMDGNLDLLKAIYNRVIKDFDLPAQSFELHTFVDAPAGSGLGTSSTLVVAVLGAFVQWLSLPLAEYDIASLAYSIEREDLCLAGGKQDQYAATFGGFNFMEFYSDNKVIVNPLRIKDKIINELSRNIVLFYTSTSRDSAAIIERQQKNVISNNTKSIDAMQQLKKQAVLMKEALLKNDLDKIGDILNLGWEYKRQMASGISTNLFEDVYRAALEAGARGGKISGAGGGGYIFFYCPDCVRYKVIDVLNNFGGKVRRFEFTKEGLQTWQM
ncbi:MAG: dehydrogenase [Candidatus Onthomorpha sp.]|nr:dehydrogenase [Bacteroidales bacterium]MDY3976947.1 dehydrogenase [Candidatus Onthomorpha sp.]MDD5977361.1 dehydrogenase [Bacteroidales bacterium]MDD6166030.1 dehydrogenase [Bacteroidales bacterium]MDD6614210.1 dehydrogenase [Bacteroidales bacterium]